MEYQYNYALDMIQLEGQCFANESLNIGSCGIASVPRAMRTPTRQKITLCRHNLMNA